MPMRMTTSIREVEGFIKAQQEALERVVVNVLARVGEECLTIAREQGNYTDRTGNLRSSIGYAVVNKGFISTLGFVKLTKEGHDGADEGLAFLRERASKASKDGISLVMTAGMDYAAYVEAMKGKWVLSKVEIEAPKKAKDFMQQCGFKIK